MEIRISESGSATVVHIQGSVDGLTAETLQSALSAEVKNGHVRLVADFSGVVYTSSAGLRVLLATVKETRQKGGDFRVAAVSPDVRKVLDISGFTSILKLFPDVETAAASFGA